MTLPPSTQHATDAAAAGRHSAQPPGDGKARRTRQGPPLTPHHPLALSQTPTMPQTLQQQAATLRSRLETAERDARAKDALARFMREERDAGREEAVRLRADAAAAARQLGLELTEGGEVRGCDCVCEERVCVFMRGSGWLSGGVHCQVDRE